MGAFKQAANCMLQQFRRRNSSYLVVDLYKLDEDRQRQAEENVADHHPASAKVFVDTDRRDESPPRLFISKH